MILLRNNKLEKIDVSEQKTTEITVVKTIARMQSEDAERNKNWPNRTPTEYVNDKIYKVMYFHDKDKFNMIMTQSPWKDNSGIGNYYSSYNTKGELLYNVIQDGYEVYVDGIKIASEYDNKPIKIKTS